MNWWIYLIINNLIIDKQHGFVPLKGCKSNKRINIGLHNKCNALHYEKGNSKFPYFVKDERNNLKVV